MKTEGAGESTISSKMRREQARSLPAAVIRALGGLPPLSYLQRKVLAPVVLASVGVSFLSQPAAGQSTVTKASRMPNAGGPAWDFTLVTQDGKPFTLSKDGAGRPLLVTFIFTSCPGACPLVVDECLATAKKAAGPKKTGGKPLVVAVSFDPAVDTPERLRAHARERHLASSDVVFLTGDQKAIDKVVFDYGVNVGRDKNGDLFHGFQTVVIDRKGQIVSRWYGADIDSEELLADVRKASAR